MRFHNVFRLSQVGVVSYGIECPSHGVYGRVTEVKYWIKFLAQGAEDTNCNTQIPVQEGKKKTIIVGIIIKIVIFFFFQDY